MNIPVDNRESMRHAYFHKKHNYDGREYPGWVRDRKLSFLSLLRALIDMSGVSI